MTKTALFAAAACALSPLSFPLPFSPVPITLSVLVVLLAGAFLPPGPAALSQVIRILLGVAGLPVFAGWQSGPGYLLGPSGGYLLITPVMSLLVALAAGRGRRTGKQKAAWLAAGMTAAMLACYGAGTLWLALSTGRSFGEALLAGVVPFIPLDAVKLALAHAAASAGDKWRPGP